MEIKDRNYSINLLKIYNRAIVYSNLKIEDIAYRFEKTDKGKDLILREIKEIRGLMQDLFLKSTLGDELKVKMNLEKAINNLEFAFGKFN